MLLATQGPGPDCQMWWALAGRDPRLVGWAARTPLKVGPGQVAYGDGCRSGDDASATAGSLDRCAETMGACYLQAVWASKYNERAYYSTRKVGINFEDVRMAVLTQVILGAGKAPSAWHSTWIGAVSRPCGR